jgi:hypothetical protein
LPTLNNGLQIMALIEKNNQNDRSGAKIIGLHIRLIFSVGTEIAP